MSTIGPIKLYVPVEWKVIKDYPDYMVSNYGFVKSFKLDPHGRNMNPTLSHTGYKNVELYGELHKHKQIHALVGAHFIPYPEGAKAGEYTIDHIDRNKTNNFVGNLRWATHSEQMMNQAKKTNCTSRFRCVTKRKQRWGVEIRHNSKKVHIGHFATEEDAAKAYNDYVIANSLPNILNVI
jgi:hypothetical protein